MFNRSPTNYEIVHSARSNSKLVDIFSSLWGPIHSFVKYLHHTECFNNICLIVSMIAISVCHVADMDTFPELYPISVSTRIVMFLISTRLVLKTGKTGMATCNQILYLVQNHQEPLQIAHVMAVSIFYANLCHRLYCFQFAYLSCSESTSLL